MLVWGFFYGGLIHPEVMARVGLRPEQSQRGSLPGYELTIAPLVNLRKQEGSTAFGLLMSCTHENLSAVYAQLQQRYLPCPVLAFDAENRAIPALCYLVPNMAPGQAERDHVMNLLTPAQSLGFPSWYLDKIRSFLPPQEVNGDSGADSH